MPSETVPFTGTEVCTSTTSGGSASLSKLGTSDNRHGKYRRRLRPRIPAPTNADSRITPSRSGTPGCAFSANRRYSAVTWSRMAKARQGVAKLPLTTTRGMPGSPPRTAPSFESVTTRIETFSQFTRAYRKAADGCRALSGAGGKLCDCDPKRVEGGPQVLHRVGIGEP
jgi:hypothetical protein